VTSQPDPVLNEIIRRALEKGGPDVAGCTMNEWARTHWRVLGCQSANALRLRATRLLREGLEKSQNLVVAEDIPTAPAEAIRELRVQLERAHQRSKRTAAWEEIFRRTVEDCLTSFQPVEIPQVRPTPASKDRLPELAVPIVSDMHTGAFHTPEETAGLTQFNQSILLDEVRRWKTNLSDCLAVVRSGVHVSRCLMLWLGDMVTGEDIYPKQLAEIDAKLMDQIILTAYILADMVLHCAKTFEKVEIIAVEGNHGRTQTTTLSIDRLVYIIVQLLLRGQKNVTLHLSQSPFVAFSEPSVDRSEPWNYLVSHGQDVKAWNRIPYYGLDRARAEWIDLTGLVYDSVIVGHHHRYAETAGWIMNGTWVPGSKYSVSKMRAASQATQGLLFHNPKIGWTSRWPLYLTERPRYPRVDVTDLTIHTPTTDSWASLLRQTLPPDLQEEPHLGKRTKRGRKTTK